MRPSGLTATATATVRPRPSGQPKPPARMKQPNLPGELGETARRLVAGHRAQHVDLRRDRVEVAAVGAERDAPDLVEAAAARAQPAAARLADAAPAVEPLGQHAGGRIAVEDRHGVRDRGRHVDEAPVAADREIDGPASAFPTPQPSGPPPRAMQPAAPRVLGEAGRARRGARPRRCCGCRRRARRGCRARPTTSSGEASPRATVQSDPPAWLTHPAGPGACVRLPSAARSKIATALGNRRPATYTRAAVGAHRDARRLVHPARDARNRRPAAGRSSRPRRGAA